MTDSQPGHAVIDKHPEQLATTMIAGQDGVPPVWDGKTVPFNQYGQPPRIIRVTFKINEQQVLGNKPITNADIVPNDTETTIMLK